MVTKRPKGGRKRKPGPPKTPAEWVQLKLLGLTVQGLRHCKRRLSAIADRELTLSDTVEAALILLRYDRDTIPAADSVAAEVQAVDDVVHLIAQKLWEPRLAQEPVARASRDFH